MNSKKISMMIAVVVLFGTFWYVYRWMYLPMQSAIVQNNETQPPVFMSADTSDWVVYENHEYGFRFKHPKELEVVDGKNSEEAPYAGVFIVLSGMYLDINNPRRGEVGESDPYMIEIHQVASTTSDYWNEIGRYVGEVVRGDDAETILMHKDKYKRITQVDVFSKNSTYFTLELRGFEPEFTENYMSEIKDPLLIESMKKYPEFLKTFEGVYSTFEIIS